MDLLTGQFTAKVAIAIGDDESGLSFTREIRAGQAIDNMLGEITISGTTYTVVPGEEPIDSRRPVACSRRSNRMDRS